MKIRKITLFFALVITSAIVNAQITSELSFPVSVQITTDNSSVNLKANKQNKWSNDKIQVAMAQVNGVMSIDLSSPTQNVKKIVLKWAMKQKVNSLFMADHWERSYGDLSWQKINPNRILPWYFMVFDGNITKGFGVMTKCHSFASWAVSNDTLSLMLDTRNGSKGVVLGSRMLRAAEIITYSGKKGESAFASTTKFCTMMCPKPRLPKQPVYGINDWYFAYGNNSADLIMTTVNLMSPLAKNKTNRPFCVIDDGWSKKDDGINYSWCSNYGEPNAKTFGDMAVLAAKIKKAGMRPGLWTRPLCASQTEKLVNVLSRTRGTKEQILDPTVPENIKKITNYFKLYQKWGYEMVKHDFTTFDLLGKWGGQMLNDNDMTSGNWNFSDQSITTAEVLINLYTNIRLASGNMYLIGCNTVGHLSAGLFELQRTGDDTSGHEWARTRRMGVNTVAFRATQHNTFYAVDGDCVGLTTDIPWSLNKQWLQLLAESATPLFISAQPEALGAEQKAYIEKCFDIASKPAKVGQPLDWMQSLTPSEWLLLGKKVKFDWGK